MKHPKYDYETFPYAFLRDGNGISLVDTKALKILQLVKAPLLMDQLSIHYLGIII